MNRMLASYPPPSRVKALAWSYVYMEDDRTEYGEQSPAVALTIRPSRRCR